ncbi:MAG: hypothetical protein ACUVUG_08835 [Candidatus Aminicenantia bacterium]
MKLRTILLTFLAFSVAFSFTEKKSILEIIKIIPSQRSIDYVKNKKQFHLFTLLTEQRHPKTWNLSMVIQDNTLNGLKMLFDIDDDIATKINKIAEDTSLLEQAVSSVEKAIKERRKIYFYGCGATGRLAKQMESTFWRPFWLRLKGTPYWEKIKSHTSEEIENSLIGEMTGGDRALISSLEGFEDLQLIGKLQLIDRGIKKGDVVFCVTEGGETSSVIGTILHALSQYEEKERGEISRKNLYFVYNNPDELLKNFERSWSVISNPGITKINLTTGPQAITGSTRMQATTIETFVLGAVLEEAISRFLKNYLNPHELSKISFPSNVSLRERLLSFKKIKESLEREIYSLSKFTDLEAKTYKKGRFSTYFAKRALITVFIDSTERSPTFRLYPLDTVNEKERKCWIQVWTEAKDIKDAWRVFLGRDFRGLAESLYREPFENQIEDIFLKESALKSLKNAGNEQELLYDFSFSEENVKRRGPSNNDLGVIVFIYDELEELKNQNSSFRKFIDLFKERGGKIAIVGVGREEKTLEILRKSGLKNEDVFFYVSIPDFPDPLTLRAQIALKMLLNSHSTGVMAKLGRVVGNTMTNVSPSNLKLIGRATYLIMSHVNDTISQKEWIEKYGDEGKIDFSEANAVLFESMDFVQSKNVGQTAEVALSIIRILEALRKKEYVSWEETLEILNREGLEKYLKKLNPALRLKTLP